MSQAEKPLKPRISSSLVFYINARFKRFRFVAVAIAFVLQPDVNAEVVVIQKDVVVYGATPAGIADAVQFIAIE